MFKIFSIFPSVSFRTKIGIDSGAKVSGNTPGSRPDEGSNEGTGTHEGSKRLLLFNSKRVDERSNVTK